MEIKPVHIEAHCQPKNLRASTARRSTTSSAPRRTASTRSAAWARSAACRTSTTWCSSARRCRAIRWKAIARSARRKTVLGTRFAKKPIELAIPITIAGMSFGALSAQREGSARPRGDRDGHLDHHRRRRHDRRKSAVRRRRWSTSACRRATASTRTTCGGRRDRDRHRPGRQAGRRRHAARTEGQSARGEDAHVAGRRRSALGVAVIRTGPVPTIWPIKIQELREITDWENADLREGRRDARVQRREARGACRRRCDRGRRHAGRHGRDADRASSSTSAFRRSRRCARRSMRSKT